MYEIIVKVNVETFQELEKMTKEDVLAFIKKHMGYYSDYDKAKLVEVLEVKG